MFGELSGSVEVELNDLDRVGRQGQREIVADLVQDGLDRNDAFGIVD